MSKCTMYRLDESCGNPDCFSYKSWNMFCPIPPTNTTAGERQNEGDTSSLTFPEYKSPFSSSFSFLFRPPFSRIRFCAQRKKTVLGGGRQIGEGCAGTKKTLSSREEEEICRHPSLLPFPFFPQIPGTFSLLFLLATRVVRRRRGTNDASLLAEQGCKAEGGRRREKIDFPLLILLSTYGLLYLPLASRQVHELQVYTGRALLLWTMISYKSRVAPFHGVRVASNDKTCWQILILAWPGWLHNISARDCKNCVTNSNSNHWKGQ